MSDARNVSPEQFRQSDCEHPATRFFRLLGRSRALDVLGYLTKEADGPQRFSELETALSISSNTLTKRLDEFVEAGLVDRQSYDEVPPHVEYRATEKARDLEPMFEALYEWALEHERAPNAACDDRS